jgi:hypothetical protein
MRRVSLKEVMSERTTLGELLALHSPDNGSIMVRATTSRIHERTQASCSCCNKYLSFNQKKRSKNVIVNAYQPEDDSMTTQGSSAKTHKWVGSLHFHEECYVEIGTPFGDPENKPPKNPEELASRLVKCAMDTTVRLIQND